MFLKISSICKKQIVALTGLGLVLFVISHLAGNLFIYGGQEAFNAYAAKMESFGLVLKCAEYGLLFVFLIHVFLTASLVLENIKARGGLKRYAVDQAVGDRSWATRLMPYSGTYIFIFVVSHLFDFAFADDEGVRSFIAGKSAGIYGIVVNSFANPLHSVFYIVAICCLGLHLSHGVESIFQTLGYNRSRFVQAATLLSRCISLLIVFGFCSIPVYVLFFLK